MRTKGKQIFDFSTQYEYDVIVLVETWLNSDFSDAEFFDTKLYSVYRKDRNAILTGCLKGGGVLVAVKSCFKSAMFNIDDSKGLLDQLVISISGLNMELNVCVSYIPPASPDSIYNSHIDNILMIENSMGVNSRICVFGDFNLKDLHWTRFFDNNSLFPSHVNKINEINFVDSLFSLNLIQINHFANQLNRFLDLIFVPYDCKFIVYESLLPISLRNIHHLPLVVEIESYQFFKISPTLTLNNFNFNLCNFDVLNSLLDEVDWLDIFTGQQTSSCYDIFLQKVLGICRETIPFKQCKPYKLPWYTKGLKRLKNLRNKFHKRFLESGNPDSQLMFAHYQREFNFLNKFLYKQYIIEKEDEIKGNPKSFWSFIKSKKQVSDIPTTVKYGDVVAQSCNDSVNLFANFFKSNFDPASSFVTNFSNPLSMVNIGNVVISEDEVFNAIMQIKNSFKSDADGLCAHLLKKSATALTFALTFIFNLSLREGVFIDQWKSATITPVFKNGKRDDVTCYRPISKLSSVSKIFEHVIYKRLFFITKAWITPKQHGFFAGRSTTTNLTVFNEYCISAFEQGSQVEAIYTDFSKAFDKVSHSILFAKLQNMGFHANFLKWIESYITGRVCRVVIENFQSEPYLQTSGVPQGSILGPLLFNLFINDISYCFKKSSFLLYADDLKFYLKANSLRDIFDLQIDLDRLNAWCVLNKLHLNLSKCVHMSFYRCNNPIQFVFKIGNYFLKAVKSNMDLGVVFDSSLSFVNHIEYIIPRAYKVLGFLRRNCSEFTDPNTLKLVYISLVRSKLEYASPVWSPRCDIHISRVERVQRKFLKFVVSLVTMVNPLPTYELKCSWLGIQTLEFRRKVQSAVLVFDIINGGIDCPDLLSLIPFYVQPRSLRYVEIFNVPCHRTNYALNSTLTRAFTCLNTININQQRESNQQIEFCTSKFCFKNFLFKVLK